MSDILTMNPKGKVKIELYDDNGVFFTKEKRNLITLGANEIVAKQMSNPAKMVRDSQVDQGNTENTANGAGFFVFPLTYQPSMRKKTTIDVSSSNQDAIIKANDLKNITKLVSVKLGQSDLEIDQDVFLKDAEEGVFEFNTAPTEEIVIIAEVKNDEQVQIVHGTEVVKVEGEEWKKAKAPNDLNKEYAINYNTGEVLFERPVENIEVSYDYLKHYGLGYMALGSKPENHPDHRPVSFSESDKVLNHMENEIEGSRMPIIYPAEIEEGKPEIDLFITKPIEKEEKTVTIITHVATKETRIDSSYKKLIELKSVTKIVEDGEDIPLTIGEDVFIKNPETAVIEFAEETQENDKFFIEYVLEKNKNHLTYELSLAPVVELVSVVHEHAHTNVRTPYKIVDRGMKPGSGDVWLLNSNKGILQFKENPEQGAPLSEPGQLTIEYRVNAGKTVKFIAEFPKGVPGPIKTKKTETFTSQGETLFILNETVAQEDGSPLIEKVTVNGQDRDYQLHADRRRVEVVGVLANDVVEITYTFEKETHEIYQVAMFDEKDPAKSKMFNISGIGPVTKDKNTGMRITWSVTF